MNSIDFPQMFNTASTRLISNKKATVTNIKLLLQTSENELLGDPYFGTLCKYMLFDQNNNVLKDVVIDELYTKLAVFIPQIRVNRTDIKIYFERAKVTAKIRLT